MKRLGLVVALIMFCPITNSFALVLNGQQLLETTIDIIVNSLGTTIDASALTNTALSEYEAGGDLTRAYDNFALVIGEALKLEIKKDIDEITPEDITDSVINAVKGVEAVRAAASQAIMEIAKIGDPSIAAEISRLARNPDVVDQTIDKAL